MQTVLAFTDAEGLKIVVPVAKPGESEAHAVERAALPFLRYAPVAIPKASIPQARDYRGAWILDGTKVVEDVARARPIALQRCRIARDAKLAKTDGDWLKANEHGNASTVQALRDKRQALRDLPATIEAQLNAAETMQALRAVDLTGGL